MRATELTNKPIRKLTDEEIDYLLSISRRLPGASNIFDIPGTKFGYSHLVEEEQIRRHLLAGGGFIEGSAQLYFAVKDEMVKRHRGDLPFRVYQQQFKSMLTGSAKIAFTTDELEHIVKHFSGANDPFVQQIVEKAVALIERNREAEQ